MPDDAAAARCDASTGLLAATATSSYSGDDHDADRRDRRAPRDDDDGGGALLPLPAAAEAEEEEEEAASAPWPATFERFVALLSQPIPDRKLVALAMRSLPPTTLRKNVSCDARATASGWRRRPAVPSCLDLGRQADRRVPR